MRNRNSTDDPTGDEPVADVVVDARGRRCPVPVIELARAVAAAVDGTVVAVLSDDGAARLDVPAWCRMRGHVDLGAFPLPDGSGTAHVVRRAPRPLA